MERAKPRCYFCAAQKPLRILEFHVTINGKLVLEKHRVCEECQKQHLSGYH